MNQNLKKGKTLSPLITDDSKRYVIRRLPRTTGVGPLYDTAQHRNDWNLSEFGRIYVPLR